MSQYAYDTYIPARQSNGLGLAGFICSLVGLLVTGGLLCPIGVILSLVALGRPPRGFAIAGLIIGLIGTCGGLIIALAFGLAIAAVVLGVGIAALAFSNSEKLEITTDMIQIAVAVQEYKEANNYLPAGLELLSLPESTLTDPWGQRYRYVQIDPQSEFDLITAGEDKSFDTEDDAKLSEIDKMWAFRSGGVDVSQTDGSVKIDLGGANVDITSKDESTGAVRISVGGRTIEVTGEGIAPPATPSVPETPVEPEVPDAPTPPQDGG